MWIVGGERREKRAPDKIKSQTTSTPGLNDPFYVAPVPKRLIKEAKTLRLILKRFKAAKRTPE